MRGAGIAAPASRTIVMDRILNELEHEIARQDAKHGPFVGTRLGRSRLAIACIEDEYVELLLAWRDERKQPAFLNTRAECLQVAAVAIRAVRDAFAG